MFLKKTGYTVPESKVCEDVALVSILSIQSSTISWTYFEYHTQEIVHCWKML